MPSTDLGGIGRYRPAATLTDSIMDAINEETADIDLDALTRDYRAKVNVVLDGTGISLAGDEFYGEIPVPDDYVEVIDQALSTAWDQIDTTSFDRSVNTPPLSDRAPRTLHWKLSFTEGLDGTPAAVELTEDRRRFIGASITLGLTEGPFSPSPDTDSPSDYDALVDLAEELDLDNVDLMEIVHEVHGRNAAQVNNNGVPAQITYLLGQLDAGEVEALIRDAAADDTDGAAKPSA